MYSSATLSLDVQLVGKLYRCPYRWSRCRWSGIANDRQESTKCLQIMSFQNLSTQPFVCPSTIAIYKNLSVRWCSYELVQLGGRENITKVGA